MRWRLVASLILAAASEGLTIAAAPNVTEKNLALVGVVVEEVGKGFSGRKGGIKPGDVLVSWESIGSTPADRRQLAAASRAGSILTRWGSNNYLAARSASKAFVTRRASRLK